MKALWQKFPVAGYDRHFLPATKAIPKEMLLMLTKPPIQINDVLMMLTKQDKVIACERFDCGSVKGFAVNDNTILQETILHLNGPNNLVGYRFLAVDL